MRDVEGGSCLLLLEVEIGVPFGDESRVVQTGEGNSERRAVLCFHVDGGLLCGTGVSVTEAVASMIEEWCESGLCCFFSS